MTSGPLEGVWGRGVACVSPEENSTYSHQNKKVVYFGCIRIGGIKKWVTHNMDKHS